MKAACYQFNPIFGNKDENLKTVINAVKNADVDLLVLPEFFATGYQFISTDEVIALSEPVKNGQTIETLISLSRDKKIYIVGGFPELHNHRCYNSAVLTGPEGLIGLYRKTHLFFEEKLYFEPGDTGFNVWDTAIGKIGIMICFDWLFPESARALALKGADVIAHPSNLVLPYCPNSMPLRCLENRVYAITANRTGTENRKVGSKLTFIGQSQIVSPRAEIIVRAKEDEDVLLSADLDISSARDKRINQYNDLINDRRPEYYG